MELTNFYGSSLSKARAVVNISSTTATGATPSQCTATPIQPLPTSTLRAATQPEAITDREKGGSEALSEASTIVNGDGTNAAGIKEDDIFPEGGLPAWLVVLGCFSGLFAALGTMNSIGIYQAYLSHNQLKDYSEASIGWIFSIYSFLTFFGGVQVGPIFDAKGPRVLVITGSVLIVLSYFLMGICTAYWHFLIVIGIIGGMGCTLVFTPSIATIGHWFLVRRGLATGVAMSAGGLGGIVLPLMLQNLFDTVGWAWATRIVGFLELALCIIACVFMRARLPPKPGGSILPDPRVFRNKAFALTTAGVWFQEWGLFMPIAYLTSYGIRSGAMSSAFTYQLVAIFNAASVVGRLVPGLLADKIGRYNTMLGALLICSLSALGLWLPASVLTLHGVTSPPLIQGLSIAFAITIGFGSGSNLSLTPVCVGQLCHTSEYGRYYASCYTLVSIATLTGIPIGGALLSACGGEYHGLVLFTGLCYALCFAAFLAVRVLQVGWKLRAVF